MPVIKRDLTNLKSLIIYHYNFLGVILGEKLEKPIKKLLENVGIPYKAKFILNRKSLKSIYYAFIHSYINYAAWGRTHQTKLRKHAVRIIYNEDRQKHAKPLVLTKLNTLSD